VNNSSVAVLSSKFSMRQKNQEVKLREVKFFVHHFSCCVRNITSTAECEGSVSALSGLVTQCKTSVPVW